MNDLDFFEEIVCPTVEEFFSDRLNVRRAITACLVMQAMNEHYFENNKDNTERIYNCTTKAEFKSKLRNSNWAIGHVMDIANGIKHVSTVRRDGLDYCEILKKENPGKCDIFRVGFPIGGEEIFTDNSFTWILRDILKHVLEYWRSKLTV